MCLLQLADTARQRWAVYKKMIVPICHPPGKEWVERKIAPDSSLDVDFGPLSSDRWIRQGTNRSNNTTAHVTHTRNHPFLVACVLKIGNDFLSQ